MREERGRRERERENLPHVGKQTRIERWSWFVNFEKMMKGPD